MGLTLPGHLKSGSSAENCACRYLKKRGLKLLTRNYRSPFGEIDLIMKEKDMLVFVEVRYRKNTTHGSPAETVDFRKQKKLRATAEHYLQRLPRNQDAPCRFDIVTYTGHVDDQSVGWIQNALS